MRFALIECCFAAASTHGCTYAMRCRSCVEKSAGGSVGRCCDVASRGAGACIPAPGNLGAEAVVGHCDVAHAPEERPKSTSRARREHDICRAPYREDRAARKNRALLTN